MTAREYAIQLIVRTNGNTRRLKRVYDAVCQRCWVVLCKGTVQQFEQWREVREIVGDAYALAVVYEKENS